MTIPTTRANKPHLPWFRLGLDEIPLILTTVSIGGSTELALICAEEELGSDPLELVPASSVGPHSANLVLTLAGGRLVEAEPNALVVAALDEPPKTTILRTRLSRGTA